MHASNPPDILKTLLQRKVEEVAERKEKHSLQEMQHMALDTPPGRDFYGTIQNHVEQGYLAVIAEIKKASPSRGLIRKDFKPGEIAESYTAAGAVCLSVVTDVDFFHGHDDYIKQVKQASALPVLRKDFTIDCYQIYEAKTIGADCILLIVAALNDVQLQEFAGIATELNMDILVEVHDREELERAMMLRTPLIGINNRNLHTFETSLETTLGLLTDILPDRTIVTESGIRTKQDIKMLHKNGVNVFLVGEIFMAAPEPGEKLKELFDLQ